MLTRCKKISENWRLSQQYVLSASQQTVTNKLAVKGDERCRPSCETRKFDRGLNWQFYMKSSIGWMFPRGLNTSSVWWCTGACTDRHLATSLITSSQLLMLLLAAAVYDLPSGTVSLCLAVDSARTAVGRSTMPPRNSLPGELGNSDSCDCFYSASA